MCRAQGTISSGEIQLKLVHLIWRHGDRNPEKTYPTDPYKDPSFWPDGFGELTRTGMKQHHELGKYFRNRYITSGFLQPRFDPKEVFVESSSLNRTIQSAFSNLRGFFNESELITDADNNYVAAGYRQNATSSSIPVNLLPMNEDNKLLQVRAPCPKWEQLHKDLPQNSVEVRELLIEHGWLLNYVSNHSGQVISNFIQLSQFNNILYIQTLKNYTIPEWTRKIFPGGAMQKLSNFAFKMATYTEEMKRLRGGPLVKEIIRHMDHRVRRKPGTKHRKLYAYSAHDLTLTAVLDTLGVYDVHQPSYASALMIELNMNVTSGNYFVDVLYRNDTSRDPYVLQPLGCPQASCDLKIFIRKFQRFLPKNWHEECKLSRK
ncbi:Lysosomal acid phosphatase [Folsomia candida]|uniref:acid phosphatase n=2 Tax=Folsomia candida TaxID=158441 RepID=A0A226E0U7_FOLCA|nr:Lysosomal acid phosphatase [Folsomia candida]